MPTKIYAAIVLVLVFNSCKEKKPIAQEVQIPLINPIIAPVGTNSSLPYLFSNNDKTLMSWVEKIDDSLVRFQYAELKDGQWQEANEILTGKDWFVNWADFPIIAENNGNLFSHILKKSSAETFSYDVKLNLLPEGENNWKKDIPLHTDGTLTEHGFVSALPYKDAFFVTWLDGRNTEAKEGEERGAMTIRAAEVSTTGEVSAETVLDVRACDCCQTTAAITTNGPVVLYRDRSDEEVRDMSIVRFVDGAWTQPKIIFNDGWKIKGCPVNGPKAAVLDNSLAVAWFTAANKKPEVKIVFSEDGGANFDAPVRVDRTKAMGRVDVLLIDNDTAIVSWMEAKDKGAQIKAVKVTRNAKKGTPITIAELEASRKTGFPQMELVGDKVYFAWTEIDGASTTIKTAYVNVKQF